MNNLNDIEFYEMMMDSLFLNYGKNISKDIDIFYIGSSNSRTSALMFKIVLRLKNNSQDSDNKLRFLCTYLEIAVEH